MCGEGVVFGRGGRDQIISGSEGVGGSGRGEEVGRKGAAVVVVGGRPEQERSDSVNKN